MATGPTAEIWYSLFNLYSIAAVAINIVIIAIMLYFIVRYREGRRVDKEERSIDVKKLTLTFIAISAVIFYSLEFYTLGAMRVVEEEPDQIDIIIRVVAFQWGWRFIYPNGTSSVGVLKVPKGATVLFVVTSNDVHHKFGIPDYKASIDAVPGRVNKLWVRFDTPGVFTVRCYELCGLGHARMLGKIVVTG